MPIYEYRCSNCGTQKEFLQKVSDPPHTVCPECGQATFSKMVTAAGFQLKGTGWYVTDFRNGSTASAKKDSKSDTASTGGADASKSESGSASTSSSSGTTESASTGAASKPDAPAPAA